MSSSPLFGDVLSERRHSLGLSVDRVVADTKLQRRMVEAFEGSDFDAMPPRGYAQASLASYARYLGLDAQELLRDYEDQLYDHQREQEMGSSRPSARGGRGRDARPAGRGGLGQTAADAREPRAREREPWADDGRRPSSEGRGYSRGDKRDYARDGREPESRQRRSSLYGDYAPVRQRDLGLYDRPTDSAGRALAREGGQRGWEERGSSSRGEAPSGRAAGRLPGEDRRRVREGDRYGERYEEDRPGRPGAAGYAAVGGARPSRASRRDEPVGRGRPASWQDSERPGRPRPARQPAERRRTELVGPDDGYEGGSGGERDQAREHLRTRSERRGGTAARETLEEVLGGLLAAVREDRRTFTIIVAAIACTLVVVLAVSVSSCARSTSGTGSDAGGNIPVTPVAQDSSSASNAGQGQTQLQTSVDLDAMPAGSSLKLFVADDAASGPWIEVYVDGSPVRAETVAPGFAWEWPFSNSITVRLSGVDGVTLYLNDVQVSPTLDNGAYVLTATVAADQQPQQDAESA